MGEEVSLSLVRLGDLHGRHADRACPTPTPSANLRRRHNEEKSDGCVDKVRWLCW